MTSPCFDTWEEKWQIEFPVIGKQIDLSKATQCRMVGTLANWMDDDLLVRVETGSGIILIYQVLYLSTYLKRISVDDVDDVKW